jgi:hypothetical protein
LAESVNIGMVGPGPAGCSRVCSAANSAAALERPARFASCLVHSFASFPLPTNRRSVQGARGLCGVSTSQVHKSNAKSNAKRLKVGGEGYAESSRGKSTTNSNAKRLKAGDEDYVYEESARAKAGAKQSAVLEALAPPA